MKVLARWLRGRRGRDLSALLSLGNDQFRGGVAFGTDLSYSCYFPQYDAIWFPISLLENLDNRPGVSGSEQSWLRYVSAFEHEMGHRMINVRTAVGMIHVTFTAFKMSLLLDTLPKSGHAVEVLAHLHTLSRRATAFLSATKVWDEGFSVLYSEAVIRDTVGPSDADLYRRLAERQYPEIAAIIQGIDALRSGWRIDEEEKALLIRSLFDTAAAVDPEAALGLSADGESGLPRDLNVDWRLSVLVRYCADTVGGEPHITTRELAARLLAHMGDSAISVAAQYDSDSLARDFERFADRMDGFVFPLLYTTVTRQLLRDMERFLIRVDKVEGGYPVAPTTLRPEGSWGEIALIMRDALFVSVERFPLLAGRGVEVNVGQCFADFFLLGSTVDLLLRNIQEDTLPVFFNLPGYADAYSALKVAIKRDGDTDLAAALGFFVNCMRTFHDDQR